MSLNTVIYEELGLSEDVLINHIHKDVLDIFTSMVGVDNVVHQPIQVDTRTHFSDCITSMVGFAGKYNGLLCLHVPLNLAMLFTSSMLGMEVTEIDDDVNDALGEIANMLGGSFKHHLSKDGHEVRLSTPSVVSGKEYVISSGSVNDTLTLLFNVNGEGFIVSIVIEIE